MLGILNSYCYLDTFFRNPKKFKSQHRHSSMHKLPLSDIRYKRNQQYFVKGVAFKMVNTDERIEQSEIGGLLVLIIIYFKYF